MVNQGVLVGRLSRRISAKGLAVAGAVLLVIALGAFPFSPAIGRAALGDLSIAGLQSPVLALLAALAVLSLGNSLLNVALSTLVSTAAGSAAQGSAFGVTQGAGSLGRTVGPPIMTALYALVVYWSPFVLGAVLTLGIVALLTTIQASQPATDDGVGSGL